MNAIALQRTGLVKFATFLMLLAFSMLFTAQNASADLVSEGTWVNKQYSIKGGWEIAKVDGQTIIKFKDSFETKSGPDLKIFLSKKSIDEVTGRTVVGADSVLISPLNSNSGTQQYILPANIAIEDYKSLLIHCEAFSVLWGGATI